MGEKSGYVYIITNKWNTVLYIGVTSNLIGRITQHKEGKIKGFSKKYNLSKLVYYEFSEGMKSAIEREKLLKTWNREWKNDLINSQNPEWSDLFNQLF